MTAGLVAAAVFLSAAMAAAFFVAERSGRSGHIDAIWSAATGATATALALWPFVAGPTPRQWLAALLMAVWTSRLAGHIALRTAKHGDDPRYAHLRSVWGAQARRKLFAFLQMQAACAIVLVSAVAAAARNPAPLGFVDALAAMLAIGGLVGATVADRQMERFRAREGSGRAIMDEGLWALSRHPNYFFEWMFWCAWPLLALPTPSAIFVLAAPAMMYWLLRYASGIPHLEAHLARSRPEAFAAYAERVPPFFPRLTRNQM